MKIFATIYLEERGTFERLSFQCLRDMLSTANFLRGGYVPKVEFRYNSSVYLSKRMPKQDPGEGITKWAHRCEQWVKSEAYNIVTKDAKTKNCDAQLRFSVTATDGEERKV